ncbi:TIR domain-containing protein [Aciditerrimonas ferrireducens]|uniref:TIR domain-containing protein n=1 Tax=Aciditerrimonas ferrireducens TaxID=667306 RepID=UPI002005B395|nr:nucleotide-binding protein [Aciditerrimonas ferrireducens]MCK4176995.1 nucleotide-binding protein [Aciditerrimonas ferrireducens]
MAQRRSAQDERPRELPALRVPRAQACREIEDRIQLGRDMLGREITDQQGLVSLRADFQAWDDYNGGLLLKRFTTSAIHDEYQYQLVAGFLLSSANPRVQLQVLQGDIRRQIEKLESIHGRLDLYEEPAGTRNAAMPSIESTSGTATVFVVHGHDGERKLEVAQFIERVTGSPPTILHEQANRGRTIIEKFEGHAGEAGFAVVLLTGDDVGGVKGGSLQPRARQNVVLELGFFMGRLGRSHVVALHEQGVELPSDLDGILYVPLAGDWKLELAREMRAAGIDVDLNRA